MRRSCLTLLTLLVGASLAPKPAETSATGVDTESRKKVVRANEGVEVSWHSAGRG